MICLWIFLKKEEMCYDKTQCDGICSQGTSNPFDPITSVYVQPSLKQNIDRVISTITDPTIINKLKEIATQPSAYWIDKYEKIENEVKQILDDMKSGQKVVFIVYDLPNRDCAALSSNGQICCNTTTECKSFCSPQCQSTATTCDDGLITYKTMYIDKLKSLFQQYPDMTIILVIEPDSIPNCVTNMGVCTSLTCDTYAEGVTYALQQFTTLPNIVMYLDAAHGGWLGWDNNLSKYASLVKSNKWPQYLRGFSTNVSNYQTLGDAPCTFTGSDYNSFVETVKQFNQKGQCGYDPCGLVSQYNAANNELNYVQLISNAFMDAKFKTDDGKPRFIIDTGRNGNPDARLGSESCKVWCNVNKAVIGTFPTTKTQLSSIDAYFWLKTPGESDGCIDYAKQQKCDNSDGFGSQCVRYDQNCGTHPENIGYSSQQPCPPEAGKWFDYQILMLAGQQPTVEHYYNDTQCSPLSECHCGGSTSTYYHCVDNSCTQCDSCLTFADDTTCGDTCTNHHVAGQPFYVDIINNGDTETTMFMNTCSDLNKDIDTFGSTILYRNLNCRISSVQSTCTDACDWKYYDLLNKKISFTVFCGSVACGYNLTFYTSAIPKNSPYCDGQNGCTEIDFMECNAMSWHSTLHLANDDKDGTPIGVGGTIDKYSQTDHRFIDYKGGQSIDVYGNGSQFLINTEGEFRVDFIVTAPSRKITQIEVILYQNQNKIGRIYPEPYAGYFEKLSDELARNQNVLISSAWTGGMDWLDVPPCPYTPSSTDPVYIKDIVFQDL